MAANFRRVTAAGASRPRTHLALLIIALLTTAACGDRVSAYRSVSFVGCDGVATTVGLPGDSLLQQQPLGELPVLGLPHNVGPSECVTHFVAFDTAGARAYLLHSTPGSAGSASENVFRVAALRIPQFELLADYRIDASAVPQLTFDPFRSQLLVQWYSHRSNAADSSTSGVLTTAFLSASDLKEVRRLEQGAAGGEQNPAYMPPHLSNFFGMDDSQVQQAGPLLSDWMRVVHLEGDSLVAKRHDVVLTEDEHTALQRLLRNHTGDTIVMRVWSVRKNFQLLGMPRDSANVVMLRDVQKGGKSFRPFLVEPGRGVLLSDARHIAISVAGASAAGQAIQAGAHVVLIYDAVSGRLTQRFEDARFAETGFRVLCSVPDGTKVFGLAGTQLMVLDWATGEVKEISTRYPVPNDAACGFWK